MTVDVREPAVAGLFYPGNPDELSQLINRFIKNVPPQSVKGNISALICPHAGYIYSGQVAAYAYQLLPYCSFDTVIIIGPSHYIPFDGVSIYDGKAYKTPLGIVPINRDIVGKIMDYSNKFFFLPAAHQHEHSLEVQLPFLQHMRTAPFSIVPLLTGSNDATLIDSLAEAVAGACDPEKVLIIASTDLSHYHEDAIARKKDNLTLTSIQSGDIAALKIGLRQRKMEMCGAAAVLTLMTVMKTWQIPGTRLLAYANSGDVSGDISSVVGYGAAAFMKEHV